MIVLGPKWFLTCTVSKTGLPCNKQLFEVACVKVISRICNSILYNKSLQSPKENINIHVKLKFINQSLFLARWTIIYNCKCNILFLDTSVPEEEFQKIVNHCQITWKLQYVCCPSLSTVNSNKECLF